MALLLIHLKKLSPLLPTLASQTHLPSSSLLPFCTALSRSRPPQQTHFMVQYLVSSLGFSLDRALHASLQISHLRSPKNPDSVLRFLKDTGLSTGHLRTLVAWSPRILCANVEKTLRPRAEELAAHGFSGPVLVQLIRSNPCVLNLKAVLPRLQFWKHFFGGDEKNLLRAFKRNRNLINYDIKRRVKPNLAVLEGYGLSRQHIATVMMRVNGFVLRSPESIRALINRTVELGFPCGSGMFMQGLSVVAMLKGGTLDKKMELFKSYGWSEAEVLSAVKKNPNIFTLAEENVRSKMDFLVGLAGCEREYLVRRPSLLGYSLEKRLVPRHYVLSVVKSKKLSRKESDLNTAMSLSEEKFVERFILRYMEEVPDLHQTYLAMYARL